MQKKKWKDELKEIEEKFAFAPDLAKLFCGLEKKIRFFNRYEWEEGLTQEKLFKEKEKYLSVIRNLDVWDLKILFYVHNLRGWLPQQFFRVLREQYQSQCDLLNFLNGTNENVDPVGRFHDAKPKRKQKTQKNSL